MTEDWIAPDGTVQKDGSGIYRHIGYAELPVEEREDPTLRFSWTVDGEPMSERGRTMRFEPESVGRHTVTCRVENANRSAAYVWDVEAVQ